MPAFHSCNCCLRTCAAGSVSNRIEWCWQASGTGVTLTPTLQKFTDSSNHIRVPPEAEPPPRTAVSPTTCEGWRFTRPHTYTQTSQHFRCGNCKGLLGPNDQTHHRMESKHNGFPCPHRRLALTGSFGNWYRLIPDNELRGIPNQPCIREVGAIHLGNFNRFIIRPITRMIRLHKGCANPFKL